MQKKREELTARPVTFFAPQIEKEQREQREQQNDQQEASTYTR